MIGIVQINYHIQSLNSVSMLISEIQYFKKYNTSWAVFTVMEIKIGMITTYRHSFLLLFIMYQLLLYQKVFGFSSDSSYRP